MHDALVALHFQNDICDRAGKIPFSLNRDTAEAEAFLAASRRALEAARAAGWTIAHVHIGFAEDYADLPRNPKLFAKVREFGAVKRGSWGAAAFPGFEPRDGEIAVTRNCNSGFRNTNLDALLRARGVERLNVIGPCHPILGRAHRARRRRPRLAGPPPRRLLRLGRHGGAP